MPMAGQSSDRVRPILQQRQRLLMPLRHWRIDHGQGLEKELIGIETLRRLAAHPLDFGRADGRFDHTHDSFCDAILKGENLRRAVTACRPSCDRFVSSV